MKSALKKLRFKYPRFYTFFIQSVLFIINIFYLIILKNKKNILGKGNIIKYSGSYLNGLIIKIRGNNNSIIIGRETILENSIIFINGDNHKLLIGNKNMIKNTEFWFEDVSCLISSGQKTKIYGAHIAVTEPNSSIIIGQNCLFSSQIDIGNGDSHSIIDCDTNKRINLAKNINIGNNVWIGKGASILKGTVIGNDSIIGTKSVVTNSISSNCIAAGFPAKIIRKNIYWKGERINE